MESHKSNSPDTQDKTVSFKLPSEELALIKEQCEREGTTVSDHMRKLLRPTTAPLSVYDSLPRELQVNVDLQLATEKITRLESLLAQIQQAYDQERDKRKKLKKELRQVTDELAELKRESEGGLGSLVTRHPEIGEIFSNVLVRIGTSPATQKTIGALMGVEATSSDLSEDEKAFLGFGRELGQKLSPEEMAQVVKICYQLAERKASIPHVLKSLQTPAAPKNPPPGNPMASA